MNKEETLGEVAYNAYCGKRNWKSVKGEMLPNWPAVDIDIKAAWEIAAEAVARKIEDEWAEDEPDSKPEP